MNSLLGVALLFFFVAQAACSRPNILFILADDLGIGEVSTYPAHSSHGRMKTPSLARLAEEGVSFSSAYAGQPVCAPSRCSLMTGKHSGHSAIRGNKGVHGYDMPLPEGEATVAHVLKEAGYKTALVGKWGLGYNGTVGAPWEHGFDYVFSQLDQVLCHNYYPQWIWRNGQQQLYPKNRNASRTRCMAPGNTCAYAPSEFTREALDWLDGTTSAQPWFVYLALTPPHAGGWSCKSSVPPLVCDEVGAPCSSSSYSNQTDWPTVERDHAAMVSNELDHNVGFVMAKLKQKQMDQDTLVIFTSDNGPHNEGGHSYKFFNSAGPFRGLKRSLYEGGIRVPTIVRWPGHVAPNTWTAQPIAFWDFFPTFAALANATGPSNVDGIDISMALFGGTLPTRPLYWEFCTNNEWGHAIRLGDWKAVSFSLSSPMELYNITADPGETKNVASNFPGVIARLGQLAASMHKDDPNWPKVNCVSS
jgi:arylsulfatase A